MIYHLVNTSPILLELNVTSWCSTRVTFQDADLPCHSILDGEGNCTIDVAEAWIRKHPMSSNQFRSSVVELYVEGKGIYVDDDGDGAVSSGGNHAFRKVTMEAKQPHVVMKNEVSSNENENKVRCCFLLPVPLI